jgi:hypothetical protein
MADEWEVQVLRSKESFFSRPAFADVAVYQADAGPDNQHEVGAGCSDSMLWFVRVLCFVKFRFREPNSHRIYFYGRYYERPGAAPPASPSLDVVDDDDDDEEEEEPTTIARKRKAGKRSKHSPPVAPLPTRLPCGSERLTWDTLPDGQPAYIFAPMGAIVRAVPIFHHEPVQAAGTAKKEASMWWLRHMWPQ